MLVDWPKCRSDPPDVARLVYTASLPQVRCCLLGVASYLLGPST